MLIGKPASIRHKCAFIVRKKQTKLHVFPTRRASLPSKVMRGASAIMILMMKTPKLVDLTIKHW